MPRRARTTPRLEHVGLNAMFLAPRMGGLEAYVKAVVPELALLRPDLRFSVFTGPLGVASLADEAWPDNARVVELPLLGRQGFRAVTELTVLGAAARHHRCSLLHSVAMTGPLHAGLPHVVSVPDVTWIVAAETTEPLTIGLWRMVVPPVARRAQRVQALSQASADHIVRYLGVPAERIDVIPLGPGLVAPVEPVPEPVLRRRLDLPDGPIVLAVSQKRRHKNLAVLIEAVATIDGAVLVLPGNPTAHEVELKALANRLGVSDRVLFPPYVETDELEGLYRAATVFACPSINEGFGLPVLEAMRRGVPVVCSNASSLPEVAGDAALYFDPREPRSIAAAVLQVLEDPDLARRLVAAGYERERSFTWRRTAELTLESYERALAEAS
jgi:glycosyltransferase involved in cell wall biosynthesis